MRVAIRSSLLSCALLLACKQDVPAPRCRAVPAEPTPDAMQVCAHLQSVGCQLAMCADAYADWRARVPPAEFDRVASCYMHATSCLELDDCARACGADGGPVAVSDASADGEETGADAAADAPDANDAGDAFDVSNVPDVPDVPDVPATTDTGGVDAGTDGMVDAGTDTGTDVGTDVATDGTDAGTAEPDAIVTDAEDGG